MHPRVRASGGCPACALLPRRTPRPQGKVWPRQHSSDRVVGQRQGWAEGPGPPHGPGRAQVYLRGMCQEPPARTAACGGEGFLQASSGHTALTLTRLGPGRGTLPQWHPHHGAWLCSGPHPGWNGGAALALGPCVTLIGTPSQSLSVCPCQVGAPSPGLLPEAG